MAVGVALLLGAAVPASAQWSYDVVHSFTGKEGNFPEAALILASDGHIYGTTCGFGQPDNLGTIFRLEDSGDVTVLHTFHGGEGTGCAVELLPASDGNLYGATNAGGPAPSVAFKSGLDGSFTVLHVFDPYFECAEATGRLVEGLDGFFYGTCSRAYYNDGIAYRMDTIGAVTIVHTFDRADGAVFPFGLVQAADGTLFGTLASGGPGGSGGLFGMTAAGEVTMIHSFSGPDGSAPFSALSVGGDSRLYGTTLRGGSFNHGTVFGVDADGGNFVSLHAFDNSDGSDPRAGVIELADGFYGTASLSIAGGTAFAVDRAGGFTILHTFGTAGDGRNPQGGLLAVDENTLLGTTAAGGMFAQGTIFRLSRRR